MPAITQSNDYVPPPTPPSKKDLPEILFYNEKGQQIGSLCNSNEYIRNTSFIVGSVSKLKKGGKFNGKPDSFGVSSRVGFVTQEGEIIYDKTGLQLGVVSSNGSVNQKEAPKYTIGRAEVDNDIGIAYDLNGKKAGEVRGAGEDAQLYAGAMLPLLVNVDPRNAPYDHTYKRYEIPKPPIGSTYQDWSDSEKIERNKYEIDERLTVKNGVSKGRKILKTFEEQAEAAADKVAYWEGVKKEVTGASPLAALKTANKKKTGSLILSIIKKLLH
jgi:hypothetical protein